MELSKLNNSRVNIQMKLDQAIERFITLTDKEELKCSIESKAIGFENFNMELLDLEIKLVRIEIDNLNTLISNLTIKINELISLKGMNNAK